MKVERGIPLVERLIRQLQPHVRVRGGGEAALDVLESQLMVELPPTLRRYLEFDFTFESFGRRWQGTGRFGKNARSPRPRLTNVRRLAEAMTDAAVTSTSLRRKVIRLPNLPGQPWNCLYLGEPRQDGELPILGLVDEDGTVGVYVRYTSFDLYLIEQSGLLDLSDSMRHEDLESHLALNSELTTLLPEEEYDTSY